MALIQKIPLNLKIDFLGRRKICLIFSGCLVAVSLALFAIQGHNLGVDLRGGK
jgi:preprotein translocase subunit SecF